MSTRTASGSSSRSADARIENVAAPMAAASAGSSLLGGFYSSLVIAQGHGSRQFVVETLISHA